MARDCGPPSWSGATFADSNGLATKITVNLSPSPVGSAFSVINASDMNLQALQLSGPGGPPFTGTGSTMSLVASVIGSVSAWPAAVCQLTRSRLRA